jgi:hypothetical protein
MLGKPGELWILAGAGKDLGVARGHHTSTLALECSRDDGCTTASRARVDDFVDEVDQLVRKTHSYLLTHPNMVPNRYHIATITATPPTGP